MKPGFFNFVADYIIYLSVSYNPKPQKMKKILTVLILSLSMTVLHAQPKAVEYLKIAQDTYNSLRFKIKNQGIENEIVNIETDKFGRITGVDSKQEKLKEMLFKTLLIPFVTRNKEIISTSSTLTISDNLIKELKIVDFKNDTIVGQLYTAIRLSMLMEEKKYDSAINLFSKKQKANIEKIKKEGEVFNYWTSAWTFDNPKLERYTKRILLGGGDFAYEDNEWKINEN